MLNSILSTPVTLIGLLVTLVGSLILGILTALVFSYKSKMSPSLSLTLAVLPVAMSMIVLMVNGNLGIAVAVAGGFTLVRFRSIAGTGREISAVFSVMTLGVICGLGYIGIAAVFFVITAALVLLLTVLHFGEHPNDKLLRITIPEDYDYAGLFSDIFRKYGITASIDKIKTTNMGSLIEVTYKVSLPGGILTKGMLDDLRARNGNLSIMLTSYEDSREQL